MADRSGHILIVDDDPDFAEGLDLVLEPEGFDVTVTHDSGSALGALARVPVEVALIDVRLQTSSGLNLISQIHEGYPDVTCVMMTAFASTDNVIEALQLGAYDYLCKPIFRDDLLATLDRCFENQHLEFQKRQAETALRQSEDRLRQAIQLAGLGFWVWDIKNGGCTYCSEELAAIHGTTSADYLVLSRKADSGIALIHPDDRNAYELACEKLCGGTSFELEYRVLTVQGEVRYVRERSKPIFDRDGQVIERHGTVQDITDWRDAEERLSQAEKMEAIGKLTGGVAHDFNNLLAVIMGYSEIITNMVEEGSELAEYVRTISRAATHGNNLTKRLLAFARRQALRPQVIDLSVMLPGLAELFSRTLGANVELRTSVAEDVVPVMADPAQLETAILNLAINARDAMQKGGTLTISASLAQDKDLERLPSDKGHTDGFVALTIRDTGTGIPADILDRAIEPFFTTKGAGEGTGLGLSMVHGFVEQSGGHLSIDSEIGVGTRICLFLPRAQEALPAPTVQPLAEEPRGRGEQILLVEDNDDVRQLTLEILESLDYRVVAAENGKVALETAVGTPSIDLLLSDVVLPGGMNGVEVASEVIKLQPQAKVLFMSAYPAGASFDRDLVPEDANLLDKPFQKRDLAQIVRRTLDY